MSFSLTLIIIPSNLSLSSALQKQTILLVDNLSYSSIMLVLPSLTPPPPPRHLYLVVVSLPIGSLLQLLSGRDKKKIDQQVDAKILPHLGIISIVVVIAHLLHIIVVLRALALARAVVVAVVLGVDPD